MEEGSAEEILIDCKPDVCASKGKTFRIKWSSIRCNLKQRRSDEKHIFSRKRRGLEKSGAHLAGDCAHRRNPCDARGRSRVLLSDRFNLNQRKAIGWTLVLVGAVTTI